MPRGRPEDYLLGMPSPGYGGGYGGPSQRGYGTLQSLLMERGRLQGEAAMRSGDIWANTLSNLGQGIAGAVQQHQETKAKKTRDDAYLAIMNDPRALEDPMYARQQFLKVGGPEDGSRMFTAYAGGLQLLQPNRDPEKDQKAAAAAIKGMRGMKPEYRAQVWAPLAPAASKVFGGQLPEQYDDEFFNGVLVPWADSMEPPKRGKFKDLVTSEGIKAFNEETGEVGPVIGQAPAPAPKAETRSLDVQAAEALARGDQETYTRLLKVKKEMGQADDRPRITVNTGGREKPESGDVVADAWASGMAFPSTQAATTAALESFKRRGLPVPRKLSVAMQQEVIRSADTLQTIADVREAYERVKGKTGPLSYRFQEWQTKIPGISADPDFVTFNTLLRGMGNLEIKRITGAQMSEAEADRLLKGMATGTLKPEEFEAALSVMERNAQRGRDITLYGRADARGGNQGGGTKRKRARNPQTGAVVEWDGNAWVPAK